MTQDSYRGEEIENWNLYAYVGGKVVMLEEEKDSSGAWVAYGHTKDIRGSSRDILRNDGDLVTRYEYGDFGETTIRENSVIKNELMYTGAVYDRVSQQYYMNAREYHPEDGVFLTQDSYRGGIYRCKNLGIACLLCRGSDKPHRPDGA